MTEQAHYEDDAEYDLQVSRPVSVGSFKYLPRHIVVARGALINRIVEKEGADAIRSAVRR